MIDLNSGSGYAPFHDPNPNSIGYYLNGIIDNWLQVENAKQKPRDYVSTSGIGRNCLRQIQYDYMHVPKDPGKGFDGPTLRRFQSGHEGEAVMAKWLSASGLKLITTDQYGKQFGFRDAIKDNVARFKGHLDGVIIGCDHYLPMKFPALWEHKTMGAKKWNEVVKKKLTVANPVYASQISIYQAYMKLHENPALFTAQNRDTWEVYAELIPYDAGLAQRGSDKAVQVITATDHGELLPRCAAQPDHFECRWCSYAQRCWGEGK